MSEDASVDYRICLELGLVMEAEEIKKIRKELGLTQEGLAQILGVTKVTIARYEAGTIRPQGDSERKLQQLASFIEKEDEREQAKELLSQAGPASLAALLAVSSSSAAGIASLGTLIASPAILALSTLALGVAATRLLKKD